MLDLPSTSKYGCSIYQLCSAIYRCFYVRVHTTGTELQSYLKSGPSPVRRGCVVPVQHGCVRNSSLEDAAQAQRAGSVVRRGDLQYIRRSQVSREYTPFYEIDWMKHACASPSPVGVCVYTVCALQDSPVGAIPDSQSLSMIKIIYLYGIYTRRPSSSSLKPSGRDEGAGGHAQTRPATARRAPALFPPWKTSQNHVHFCTCNASRSRTNKCDVIDRAARARAPGRPAGLVYLVTRNARQLANSA